MGGGIGKSSSKSEIDFREVEGIFGPGAKKKKTREIGGNLEDILGSIGTGSEGSQAFLQELLNPTFGPQSSSEQSFLDAISSQTQGASSLRGLGPATQGGLAQNLAPELIGLRQKRLENLGQGAGFEQSQRGQAIQGLFELLGFASPQTIGGQRQKSSSFNLSGSKDPTPG